MKKYTALAFLILLSLSAAAQDKFVEVLYFHGAQRCITCMAIEKLTTEVVQSDFKKEMESGKLKFQIVDISKNEKLADKYKVSWSSLIIAVNANGKEDNFDMTRFAFSTARFKPEEFKTALKNFLAQKLSEAK